MDLKCDAWDSVLVEQHQQRKGGTFDEECIANLYKFTSLNNKQEAVERAKKDATEIEKYLRNTRKMCRQLSM
jgi:hypothetical protein